MKRLIDYLIIGAGPAGLQLGYYMAKAEMDYQIVEAGDNAGSFFQTYPRHRQLISINKVNTGSTDAEFNLRSDWNSLLSHSKDLLFTHYSKRFFPPAERYVQYLQDYASHHHLNIKYQTKIVRVHKKAEIFHLWDQNGDSYACRYLVVATGISKPYVPPIPGIELAEQYATVSIDPDEFINQKVLIIGKGNSAFETADNLMETTATIHVASPHSVTLAWKTHYVGNLRAVNNNLLDTYQLKSQNAILDATIDKIALHEGKYHVTFSYAHAEEDTDYQIYDRVLCCTGFQFDSDLFDESCKPALTINDRFPSQTSEWESTTVQGLYFAGVLTQVRDYKKTTSAFIHGFRYNSRALYHIFNKKYHNVEWPRRTLTQAPVALTSAVIERINRTSALWQQFGFFCDLIIIPDVPLAKSEEQELTPYYYEGVLPSTNSHDQPIAYYYEDVPVDYVHDSHFGLEAHYYTITLEYGPFHDEVDPFNISRVAQTNAEESERSIYLHPVIRRYQKNKLVAEHHLVENLENQWNRDVHINPLRDFFTCEVTKIIQPIKDKTTSVVIEKMQTKESLHMPHQTHTHNGNRDILVFKPEHFLDRQHLDIFNGNRQAEEFLRYPVITPESCGSVDLAAHLFVFPVGHQTPPHAHKPGTNAMVYVASGQGTTYSGKHGEHAQKVAAGDFIYIPSGVLHYTVNDGTEPLIGMLARTPATDTEAFFEVETLKNLHTNGNGNGHGDHDGCDDIMVFKAAEYLKSRQLDSFDGLAEAEAFFRHPIITPETSGSDILASHLFVLPAGKRTLPHVHEYDTYAMVYVLSGSGTSYTGEHGENVHKVAAGDFIYIPPQVVHYTINDGNEAIVAILVRTPAIDNDSFFGPEAEAFLEIAASRSAHSSLQQLGLDGDGCDLVVDAAAAVDHGFQRIETNGDGCDIVVDTDSLTENGHRFQQLKGQGDGCEVVVDVEMVGD